MKDFRLLSAQVIGQNHWFYHRNCQDAVARHQADDRLVAFVADGCSEGRHSEVGAQLTVLSLLNATHSLLDRGVPVSELPDLLYQHLLFSQIRQLQAVGFSRHHPAGAGYVRDYLLATALGLVLTPTAGLILAAGDGLIAINDQVIIRDENDTPAYPAYHLIDPRQLTCSPSQLPTTFSAIPLAPESLEKVALATDGFQPELLADVWEIPTTLALQRQLQVWGFRQKKFGDDTTIVVLHRQPELPEVSHHESNH